MENDASATRASSSKAPGGSSDLESAMEINIKTLDSKIHKFRVDKDMPVPTLKAKLVDITGIPVERQRLIFRGRVLKDDHLLSEYHLEDGHTLHLVARQPVEGQTSSGTGSEGIAHDNNNQGNDPNSGVPRNRIGQVSHSVLLGTVNMADQGESMVADIGRLVGSVLSSLGIGTSNGAATYVPLGAQNQVPSSLDAERTQNAGGRPVSGNPPPPSFTVLNHPSQSVQQIPQFSTTGVLSRNLAIPDSLTTLTEFITRMEIVLQVLQNGSITSANNANGPRHENMPSTSRGLPTPETLRMVMEQAQQLLRGNAASALSHVALRLEREGPSVDPVVRGQIQAEAMHVGAAMQHLGSMLLELGRTIMTLHMGQSPADSAVNAGPAVYISPAGPNPLMVQPFPLQSNSLFGVSVPPFVSGVSAPFTNADSSRNINIHIHPGRSAAVASSAASRASSGEATLGEGSGSESASRDDNNNNNSGSTAAQGLPPRTVAAANPARTGARTAGHVLSVIYPVHVSSQISVPLHAIPAQVPQPDVSSGGQSTIPTVVPQPSDSVSSLVAQISAQVVNALAGTAQGLSSSSHSVHSTESQGSHSETATAGQRDQNPAGVPPGNVQGQSSSPNMQSMGRTDSGGPELLSQGVSSSALVQDAVHGTASSVQQVPEVSMPLSEGHELRHESSFGTSNLGSSGSSVINVASSNATASEVFPVDQHSDTFSSQRPLAESVDSVHSAGSSQHTERPTPLGLGLGGLQPKRRGKMTKPVGKDRAFHERPPFSQNEQSVALGQQFLHSLVSQRPEVESNGDPSNSQSSLRDQTMDGLPSERQSDSQGSNGQGQVDAADVMSHFLRTPAFDNLLSGVAAQTGIGSSADLRNMLEQCTQSPAVRNTLNGIAQQVEGQSQNIGGVLSGMSGSLGGFDLSSMIQQMMPVVTQALGRVPTNFASATVQPGSQRADATSDSDDILHARDPLVGLDPVAERIEQHGLSVNTFRSVLENATHLPGGDNSFEGLINDLGDNEELSNEFMEMLSRDLCQRTRTDSSPER